jgi:hypothetical protein
MEDHSSILGPLGDELWNLTAIQNVIVFFGFQSD